MAALSVFTDEIYHISDLKDVSVRGKKSSVKYTDNKKYAARVLAICSDEEILIKLKSTAEGITEDIGEDWICISSIEQTFVQVSKEIAQYKDNSCLYVDKVVLSQVNGEICIRALSVDYSDDSKGFFVQTSKFIKLGKKNSTVNSQSRIDPLISCPVNSEKSEDDEESLSGRTPDSAKPFVDPRIRWTGEQRSTVLSAFGKLLEIGEIPSGTKMQSLISSSKCLKGRTVPQMRSWLHTQRRKMFMNNSGESGKRGEEKVRESDQESNNSKISSESTCDKGGGECQRIQKKQSSTQEVTSPLQVNNPTILTPGKQDTDILEALKLHPNTSFSRKIDSKPVHPSHVSGRDTDSVSTLKKTPLPPPPLLSPLDLQENISAMPTDDKNDEDEAGTSNGSEREEQSSNPSVMNGEIVMPRVMNPSTPATSTGFEAAQSLIAELQVPPTETMKSKSSPPLPISDNGANSAMIPENIPGSIGKKIVSTLVEIAYKASRTHQGDENQSTHRSEIKTSKKEHPVAKATQHPVNVLNSKDFECEKNSVSPGEFSKTERSIVITPSVTPEFHEGREHPIVININGVPQHLDPHLVDIPSLLNVNDSMPEPPLSDSILEELMQNFDPGVCEQGCDGVNPFNNNVYEDYCRSSERIDPAQPVPATINPMGSNSATTAEEPKQRDNWINNVKIVNFSKVKILSDRGKSTHVRRQLRFSNENLKKKIAESSSDDDDELGQPVLHSTMNETKTSPGLNGDFRGNEAEFASDDNAQASESDKSSDENDDENYVPQKEESSEDDGDTDLGLDIEDVVQDKRRRSRAAADESLNVTLGDNPPISAPDDRELRVDAAASRTKKHFCLYCQKMQSKIARHLEFVHSKEEDVKKFLHLPPGNRERQQIISAIRKRGDYLYNTDRRYNNGKLIVCRRPNVRMMKTAEDFITCGSCKGQYAKTDLRHHFRRCTKHDGKRQRVATVKGKKIAARVNQRASHDVRTHIYPYMREDEVVRCIRYDELLTVYANKQCQKYGNQHHLFQMVRARLRLLGRFLLAMKVKDNRISEFSDIFNPRFYDTAIEAVQVVAGFDPERRIFKTPAVAANLGTLLKHVGDSLKSECIKKELVDQQRQVENFLKLLSEDFGTSINRVVAETQTQNNRRKEVILPSTEDIKKLYNFIISERCKVFSELKKGFSFDAWNHLGKMTLLSLQIFNRRRPGEIERLFLEDFRSYRGLDNSADKEAYNALSEEGKRLARKYVRFEIRGKLGRGVPVLVDNQVLECLDLIIAHREQANVPPKNLYLFGLPSSDKDRLRYHRACDLMREYSAKCGADIPSALRGTQLRKHIATRCINLNLTAGQVTDLANFMGHNENIHKNIYRQPVLETDIVKISKILNTAQGFGESDDSGDEEGITLPNTSRLSSSRGDFNDEPSTSSKSFARKSNQSFEHSSLNPLTPRRWGEKERDTVLSTFRKKLAVGKIPSGVEMQSLIDSSPCLKGRTVPQLRSWLHTQNKKKSNR